MSLYPRRSIKVWNVILRSTCVSLLNFRCLLPGGVDNFIKSISSKVTHCVLNQTDVRNKWIIKRRFNGQRMCAQADIRLTPPFPSRTWLVSHMISVSPSYASTATVTSFSSSKWNNGYGLRFVQLVTSSSSVSSNCEKEWSKWRHIQSECIIRRRQVCATRFA